MAEKIGFTHPVDGARIVRYTNMASGYPVLLLVITSGGIRKPKRIPVNRRGGMRFNPYYGYYGEENW